ncbi:MAG TPA: cation diffusion facilitator family transporter [Thermoanaerobaculia bacterium]|nr:cation diffusion facilitator family transporter [Thermoanaerobaculia bacterium]
MAAETRPTASKAPLVAVAVAGALVLLKAAGAWYTQSLALGSAAVDSLMDLAISGVNYLVLLRSTRPPDEDHAYGHGKFESIAALFQGLILVAAAVLLGLAGIDRLRSGEVPRQTYIGIAILAVSLLASLAIARVLEKAAEETESPALKADSLHYRTDFWVNGAAVAALLVVAWTGWAPADPMVAVAVSLIVLRSAGTLVWEAVGDLSDRVLPDEEIRRIHEIVESFSPEVTGMHDLKTRRSGGQRFVEFHLEIPRTASFEEAHDRTVQVLRAVEKELPRSKVFVHSDPV